MTKDKRDEGDKTGRSHPKELKSKEGTKKKKEDGIPTKVVIRRLPPTLTQETLLEELGPLPEHDFLLFVAADMSLAPHAFCRAYINFRNPEDIISFKDKFDGYVFTDSRKTEYPTVVEFAPYQKVPKGRNKKKDTKCGTIEQDPDYLKFLESLKNEEAGDAPQANIESLLEEIEARDRRIHADGGVMKMTTPLLDYIKNRRAAAARAREEAREERRRKEEERRRRREEERRKRRDEERRKKREKERAEKAKKEKEGRDKDASDGKEEESVKSVKLLKNPEREKEQKDAEKHRPKDAKRDRTPPRKDDTRRESARERRDRGRRDRRDKERDRKERDTRDDQDQERDYGKQVKKDVGDKKESTKDDKERQQQREKERERQRQRERERQEKQRREREERERKKRQERERERKTLPEKTEVEGKAEADDKEQDEARGVQERRLSTGSDTSRKSDTTEKGRGARGAEADVERELTKEEARERRRLRNKDRPTMELYRPGARRRQQETGKGKTTEESGKDQPTDTAEDKNQED